MDAVLFDSRDIFHKSPFGAVKAGETVTFRILFPILGRVGRPVLLMYKVDVWDQPERISMEYEKSDGVYHSYTCTFTPQEPQLYFYRFEAVSAGQTVCVFRDEGGFAKMDFQGDGMWQLSVYDAEMKAPQVLTGGIMYQIFPDRFCSSGVPKENVPPDRVIHQDWYEWPHYRPNQEGKITNSDYFGGDLKGIASKLDYLKSLGVGTIYLNPIFEAHSNHRYDTADYNKIDPLLGTEEDFRELCGKARELGIHIVLDGVFNHTGSDSVYFNKNRRYGSGGAYNDPNSPFRKWYDFIDYPCKYRSWWGFETLPDVNEHEPSYVDFICAEQGVLKKWLRAGASGYRLDVADELPDSFLDEITRSVKEENPDYAVIGEVWEDASVKISYGVRRRYLQGRQLDTVMNYPWKNAILSYLRYGDVNQLFYGIMDILEHYPKPVLEVLMTSLSTHDTERAITALIGDPVDQNNREWQAQHNTLSPERYQMGKRLFILASVIQYMLPGIPCLYYGDEAGLYGYKDPFNRTCYPWGREDQELLQALRSLGKIRTDYPGLSSGEYIPVYFTGEAAAFCRVCGKTRFYAAVNRTDHPVSPILPAEFRSGTILFGRMENDALAPFESVIIVKE